MPRQGSASSGPLSPEKTSIVLSATPSALSSSSSEPKSASSWSRQSAQSPCPLLPLNSARGTVGRCINEWLKYRKNGLPAPTLRPMKALARFMYSTSMSRRTSTVNCASSLGGAPLRPLEHARDRIALGVVPRVLGPQRLVVRAWNAVPLVEPVVGRPAPRRVPDVPLADDRRSSAG